ncbi:hypothetical protein LQD23_03795 [Chromobacterium violaceum]|uniref:hypothetical protein n=1 Tax=Chromobacterium violaceum TaxID=536 RepID=UPI001E3EAB0C|nr:hypothetical protein [Chromobacterium violaceum]MCD0491416.1 hypothetical protein [Chromobacterium violaceum]
MENKKWKVYYLGPEGQEGIIDLESPTKPTNEHAAIQIRNQLFDEVLLEDVNPGPSEHTLQWLRHKGFSIAKIEEASV